MPTVSGNTAQNVLRATVTLTDAQIKALPTTAVQVIAAPGVNRMVVVSSSVWRLDATHGVYTNLVDFFAHLNYGTTATPASTAYSEAAQSAFADASAVHMLGVFIGADDAGGGAAWFADLTTVTNASVTVAATNGVSGNLTGGNAANTMQVSVAYQVISV